MGSISAMRPRRPRTLLHTLLTAFAIATPWLASAPVIAAPPTGETRYERSWDRTYTDRIREYTTGDEFLTELVDHVPRSRRIPSPLDHLGYIPGAPGKLTYATKVHEYMRALADRSKNVSVVSMGKTEEGREQILVVIADARTLRRIERYKAITKRLSDPRGLDDEEAKKLISRGKPMYWLTGAMHSPETGSPEMLMELAYRLATEDTPLVRNIRNNVITMITPVLEVDGRERMVDTVRWWQQNKQVGLPPLVYWGQYVAHDNNRDSLSFALAMTRNVLTTFMEFRPQVLHDLHESVPFLYVSTGTGPYNAWLDPVAVDSWRQMAQHEVSELTRRGVPGVWNHGFYDGWAPSYMFYIGHSHNAIGRFYETYGNSTPDTRERRVGRRSERAWYRPNPPYERVNWSLRNNVNYQQSGVLLALDNVATNRDQFLETFWLLGKRAVAKPGAEGPAAYVFPPDQRRPGQLRDLLNLLAMQGVEIHRTTAAAEIQDTWPPPRKNPKRGDGGPEAGAKTEAKAKSAKAEPADGKAASTPKVLELPAGSYVIRMDQPYSRLADMLLDTQYYRADDSRPYDDTGWSLGLSKNVEVHRVVTASVLDVAMERIEGEVKSEAAKIGPGPVALSANADVDAYRWLWRIRRPFKITDEAAKIGQTELPAGSILVDADQAALDAGKDLALPLVSATGLSAKAHDGALPRVAVLHTWVRTQDEGWYRLALDELGIPYDYISTQDVAKNPELGKLYDVILFPPCGCRPEQIVNGMADGPPIPWRRSELTPHLGRVDATDDIRPGLGYAGLEHLRRFVEGGGTLITAQDTTELAIRFGLVRYVGLKSTPKLKVNGSLVQARVTDPASPLAYGYDETLPVYFDRRPVLTVGLFQPPSKPRKRPTGRGGPGDPDVVQGRPLRVETADDELDAHQRGFVPEDRDITARLQVHLPPPDKRPRVVVSYEKNPKALRLSGMLEGAGALAGTPAVVDAPVGKGHVVLFSINPMWRQQTHGTFALVINAMVNHRHLDAAWPGPGTEPSKPEPN